MYTLRAMQAVPPTLHRYYNRITPLGSEREWGWLLSRRAKRLGDVRHATIRAGAGVRYGASRVQDKVVAHLFLFAFVISFRNAGPSSGLSSSNAQSKSSDTLEEDTHVNVGGMGSASEGGF